MNRERVDWFTGQLVVREDMGHAQDARLDHEHDLHTDYWRNGILKDPNGLSNFTVTVDGTTATLINVGHGTAYANGYRIAIDQNVDYNAANPTQTLDGICTPQSSGNRGIPLANYTAGQSNFVWAEYLEQTRTSPRRVSTFDGSIHYPHRDDGYRIIVNTSNPPGNNNGLTNAVYLGVVFARGASQSLTGAPNGITDVGRSYETLILKDALGTQNYQDFSVTPQKLKIAGENFTFDGLCASTIIGSCYINVPIQPLYPNSAASKKFAQYAGFGVATSKTWFYPSYDGMDAIINVLVAGDSTGVVTPVYDGLCNITRIIETIDSRTVSHEIVWRTVNGVSQIYSVEERGI